METSTRYQKEKNAAFLSTVLLFLIKCSFGKLSCFSATPELCFYESFLFCKCLWWKDNHCTFRNHLFQRKVQRKKKKGWSKFRNYSLKVQVPLLLVYVELPVMIKISWSKTSKCISHYIVAIYNLFSAKLKQVQIPLKDNANSSSRFWENFLQDSFKKCYNHN